MDTGSDQLDAAVNFLFRLDPYFAACVTLGERSLVALLPSLVLILLILFVGRWDFSPSLSPCTACFGPGFYLQGTIFSSWPIYLPSLEGIPCMVCEEHCPTPNRAIRSNEVVGDHGQKCYHCHEWWRTSASRQLPHNT